MTFPATHPALERALIARAYTEPTSVQTAVLDTGTEERDLLVSAQTGSGKTVAFGLALAKTLLGEAERFERAAAPLALIIAPTRELAMQVQRELAWLYAETGARMASSVGGMDVRAEARTLSNGCHFVVGTPGRIRDHLERKRIDPSALRAVVLDEADEMLDLGFREDLQFILDATPETRRTLLFSATLPKAIETLARTYQRDALRIETISRNKPHADIEYRAVRVAPRDATHAIVNVLRFYDAAAALVFCATREAVKRTHLQLAERGFSAVALSGEMTQNERNTAMQALRDGRARVMVATDVAARGLDLPELALVVHADLPNDKETLLHRSGRTGRAGRKGVSLLVVPQMRVRRAQMLLQSAGVNAAWGPAPTADEIRSLDQQRLLAHAVFSEAVTDEDLVLGRALLQGRTADEIAVALMRFHRAQLPAPEDIQDPGPQVRPPYQGKDRGTVPARKPWQKDRERGSAPPAAGGEGGFRRPDRPERTDMVWFRISIGREHNADPRWLLPLICRAGGVTKAEIGAIRIFDRDTRFQIAEGHAESFAASAKAAPQKQGHISRVSTKPGADTSETSVQALKQASFAKGRPPKAAYAKPNFEKPRADDGAVGKHADGAPREQRPQHGKRPEHNDGSRREHKPQHSAGQRADGKTSHAGKPYKAFHKKKHAG